MSAHILGEIGKRYNGLDIDGSGLIAESARVIRDIRRRIEVVKQLSIYDSEVKINALHRLGMEKMEGQDYAGAILAFDSAVRDADVLDRKMVERGDAVLAIKYKRLAQLSREYGEEARQVQRVFYKQRERNKALIRGLIRGFCWGFLGIVPTVQEDVWGVILEHYDFYFERGELK